MLLALMSRYAGFIITVAVMSSINYCFILISNFLYTCLLSQGQSALFNVHICLSELGKPLQHICSGLTILTLMTASVSFPSTAEDAVCLLWFSIAGF